MTSKEERQYDHGKCMEECMELATILAQQQNKPHRDFTQEIIEEMGDVFFRLERVKKWYNSKAIEDRIEYKTLKRAQKEQERKNKLIQDLKNI